MVIFNLLFDFSRFLRRTICEKNTRFIKGKFLAVFCAVVFLRKSYVEEANQNNNP